ncbi:hypothetical protein Sjap_017339 [Stephania japonica]|uniref:DUS-like FMN-binding domain-containing protein n=1 Tax=Stephania japonica TaxID=461633 RepID=A0AAP0I601_9MAGN
MIVAKLDTSRCRVETNLMVLRGRRSAHHRDNGDKQAVFNAFDTLKEKLAVNLNVPVSCKVRRFFPNIQDTISYARMPEEAGCSLLAIHGRTRDEKDGKKFRADWNAIKTVKEAARIPVLVS